MNQKSRQNAVSSVERYFFKLLNNSNSGIDCRNNIDNFILELLHDDLGEISYIKSFTTIFNNNTFRHFLSRINLKEEIIQTFQGKLSALNKNDSCYERRKEYCENKMEEELDAVDSFEESSMRKKRKLQDIDEKITDARDPRKARMTIEFNDLESASIKSFAVEKRNEVKVTTLFTSGKLLMFVKFSLKSFICDIVETFCFPKENIKAVYNKYKIEKFETFHVLADTDSTSLMLIFCLTKSATFKKTNLEI